MKKSKFLDILIIVGCASAMFILIRGAIGAYNYWNIIMRNIPVGQTDTAFFWILLLFSIFSVTGQFIFQLASYLGNALEHLLKKQKGGKNVQKRTD